MLSLAKLLKPGMQWMVFTWAVLGARQAVVISADSRPNVLMIVVDDMNDWVGCLGGHPDVRTPNIDRLAARGLLFSNAHCAAPVCNPSRVATLTGRLPSSTGIYDNSILWHQVLPEVASLPSHFKANGYYVAGGGKVNHHMPEFNRRSDWDEYFDQVFDGQYQASLARGEEASAFQWSDGFPLNQLPAVKSLSKPPQNPHEFDWGPFDREDHQMGDGQMVQWACQWLAQPRQQPFFLATGIFRPHLPFYAPRKYFEFYPADGITLPKVKEDDLDDLPAAGRHMAQQRSGDYELVMRSGKYREFLQAYLAGISYCDTLVGQLLDALDASPAAKNTIVVLWSDHGWHLGEKQHLHKFTLWERSTRVPLIVAAPGMAQPASRTASAVGLIDVFPTLVELCGLPAVPEQDGHSLVPLLRDPSRAWSHPAITTHGQGNHTVRGQQWRYIRYADGGEELYDLSVDPNEWTNLASLAQFETIKRELAAALPVKDAVSVRKKKQLKQGKQTKAD